MVPAGYGITDEQYVERERLKSFYLSRPEGIQELCRLILTCGVFSKIDTTQDRAVQMVVAHNLGIDTLERIGLLDEEGLEELVTHLLNRGATKRPE